MLTLPEEILRILLRLCMRIGVDSFTVLGCYYLLFTMYFVYDLHNNKNVAAVTIRAPVYID